MATLHGLPVFNIKINESLDDNEGMDFISLVDYPAIEANWVTMGNDKKPMKFNTSNEKQILLGPILIPDLPIYRYDKSIGEYWVVFSKEVIEQLVRKFQATQKTINLNYQHLEDSKIAQAVVQEIWLTGIKDKSQDFGFELPAGSAFICAHIGDKTFWDAEVKTGNVRGFSIEGFLDMEMKKSIKQNMSAKKFTEVKVKNDNSLYIDGEIAVGSMVYSNQPSLLLINGVMAEVKNPVWWDSVTIEDGRTLLLKDGKIIEILNTTKMAKTRLAEAKTSDGKTIKTIDESLQVGSAVVWVDAAGVESPVTETEITLENGDVITIADGKITAINEMELDAEEESIIAEAALKAVQPLITKMQASIDELTEKLARIPGAGAATSHSDDDEDPAKKTTALSAKKKLLSKLEILRKKETEFAK